MAQIIGHISEVSGLFYAKDSSGETRLLKVGDELFIGEAVVGNSDNSASDILKLSIDGSSKELSVLSDNQLLLDDTLLLRTIEDLENLEEPAAGDTEADTLEGRFANRTAGETNISTDLRDAAFVDPQVEIAADDVAEAVEEPIVVLDDITLPTITDIDTDIELSAQNVEVDEDAIGNNTYPDTDGVINQSTDTGAITLLGAVNVVFADGQITTFTSGGETIVLTTSDDGQTITGSVGVTEIFKAALASDGLSYTFELKENIDHPSAISEDTVVLKLDIVATNNYTSKTVTIDVTIADDLPTVTNSLDTILTNEIGNIVAGVDLDIEGGADKPVGIVLVPEVNDNGFAIDTNDNLLTSTVGDDTYNLVYLPTVGGTASSVTAYQYIDASTTGDAIFTLTPDMSDGEYTGTYSILIDGVLDGVGYILTHDLNEKNATPTGGNVDSYSFTVDNSTEDDTSDDLNILVTASTATGTPLNVNFSAGLGLGVDHAAKINSGEILTLEFDKDLNEGTTFTLDHIGNNDVVGITLYDGDTELTGVSFSVTNEVLEITDLGTGTTFDKVEFTNLDSGNGFTVESLSADINTEVSGILHSINVGVDVTDSDLDIASGDIEITFDEDGVIEYEADSIVDGGTGNDTLLVEDSSELDFSTLADGKVTDIENVDLRGDIDTTVQNVTIQSVFDVTDESNMLNILADTTDRVQSSDSGWTQTGTDTIDGITYNQYQGTYNDGSFDQTVILNVQDTVVEEIV